MKRMKLWIVTSFFLMGGYELYSVSEQSEFANLKVKTLSKIRSQYPKITYQKVHDEYSFHFKPFDLSPNITMQPNQGKLQETFVVTIPNGVVCSKIGYVAAGKDFIQEFFTQYQQRSYHIHLVKNAVKKIKSIKKIKGRVAVLAREHAHTHAHWLLECLGRLEILRKSGIEYDWLYVPVHKPFIKETLEVLGVDLKKIIQPFDEHYCIKADELIVPSMTAYRVPVSGQKHYEHSPLSMYCMGWNLQFLKDSFIPLAMQYVDASIFCSKIFISRKDAGRREVHNEDEIFNMFKKLGYKRYCLTDLTFLQQVALFAQATHVIGPHGSGFANIAFCKPGTYVCEFFQQQADSTFCYLAQAAKLKYGCIKTADKMGLCYLISTTMPIDLIKNYIEKHYQNFL